MFELKITLNILQFITLFGIGVAFLISLLFLLTRKLRTRANIFVVIFMLTLALNSLYYVLVDLGIREIFPIFFYIHISIPALIPVSAYFYVYYLRPIPQKKVLTWREWLMVLPVMIDATYFITGGFLYGYLNAEQLHIYHHTWRKIFNILEEIVVMLTALTLLPGGIWLLKAYKHKLKESHAYIEKISLTWLANMLSIYAGILLLWIPPYLWLAFNHASSLQFKLYYYYPLWISSGIIACWIGTKGFLQPELFGIHTYKDASDLYKISPKISEISINEEKNTLQTDLLAISGGKDTISSENLTEYLQKLEYLMKIEKIFTDPDLHIADLAKKMGISARLLSDILSKKLQTNFYDFINKARIEEVKANLHNPAYKDYTIFGIALEMGFKSRNPFNTSFKKYTNQTPSEFKEKNEVA